MKRLILIVLVMALSLPNVAQNTSGIFKILTDKYADKDGFSASQISSEMFDLYLKKRKIDEESPVFDAIKKLDKILVISQSNFTGSNEFISSYKNFEETKTDKSGNKKNESNEIHKEILNYYKTNKFTLLKTEKRMGEDVKVYLKKDQDKIAALALVTSSSVSTNLVELQGDIDLKSVANLSQALNLRGLENLYKIDSNSYPFGVRSSRSRHVWPEERYEEMISQQLEKAEKQHAITEEQRTQFEKQAQIHAKRQMEMAEKYREMAEKYQREPIFLSYPGDTNTVYYLDGKKVKAKKIKELDKDKIESIEVTKADKKNDKTKIQIITK